MSKRFSISIIHGAWAASAAGLILALGLLLSGCPSPAPESDESTATSQDQGAQYTCPMHPEVLSDTPGKCPDCGMFLEKKIPGSMHEGGHGAKQMHETGR